MAATGSMTDRQARGAPLAPARSSLRGPGGRPWRWARQLPIVVVGAILSALFAYPFVWSFFSSLKGPTEIFLIPPRLLPSRFMWSNYVRLQEMAPFARFYLNSVAITTLTLFGMLISTALVAYGFARFRFKGRDLLFLVLIGTMIVPSEVTIVPRFIMFNLTKWIDTWLPLIVPSLFAADGFFVFLLRQFIMSLPMDLDEAAEIDGASTLDILWRILLPLMKPALATLAILGFLASWNDFMAPFIFLRTTEKFPLSVGLRFFQLGFEQGGEPREAYMTAGALLMTIPPMLVFLSAQRYYIKGIILSGIKR